MRRPDDRRRRRLLGALLVGLVLGALAVSSVLEPYPGPDAPRVLLSIDATWWNRLGLNRFTYIRALRRAGLEPVLIRFDQLPEGVDARSEVARLLADVQGVVLSGGGDVDPRLYGGDSRVGLEVKPARDRLELALIEAAERNRLPLLGICRGAQLMNVAHEGTLLSFRDDSARHAFHKRVRGGHGVRIDPDSRLAEIYRQSALERVTTYHGQAVDQPGSGVQIVAWAEDGTAEAIEIEGDGFRIGVQWHAETEWGEGPQQRLFDAFAEAVGARAKESGPTGP